jgi:hypothetical protein
VRINQNTVGIRYAETIISEICALDFGALMTRILSMHMDIQLSSIHSDQSMRMTNSLRSISISRSGRTVAARLNQLLLVGFGLLTGCTLQSNSPAPDETSSYIVYSILSPDSGLGLRTGKMVEGRYYGNIALIHGATIDGATAHKVRIEKVAAGDLVGIDEYVAIGPGRQRNVRGWACEGRLGKVIKVPRGKVIYIGDFHLDGSSGELKISHRTDLEGTKSRLAPTQPHLAARLEGFQMESVPFGQSCTKMMPR